MKDEDKTKEQLINELREIRQKVSELETFESERKQAGHTLHGILTICSSCKKIRDNKGYWNQLEAYISEHSEVHFSHGMCPECAKKLYSEFSNEK
jgi:hypothetical protein